MVNQTSFRCKGTTKKGQRCSRKLKEDGYCSNHTPVLNDMFGDLHHDLISCCTLFISRIKDISKSVPKEILIGDITYFLERYNKGMNSIPQDLHEPCDVDLFEKYNGDHEKYAHTLEIV